MMTEQSTEPAAVSPDDVTGDDTADNASGGENADKTVPLGALHEERQKRRDAEARLEDMAAQVLAQVPEDMRKLIPEKLLPLDRVAWFNDAKATGIFNKATPRQTVPRTDSGQPRTTPPDQDIWDLPPTERIALGLKKGTK